MNDVIILQKAKKNEILLKNIAKTIRLAEIQIGNK